MPTFQLKMHRYSSATGPRISGTQHISADDFAGAVEKAELIVRGMRSVDPVHDYKVISILSHDYRGTDCEGGILPFETAEEMSARLAEKRGA